ncbi:MAG: class I SAM-dependent methyltransferase [Candidatus Sericytochromatia bacterium]
MWTETFFGKYYLRTHNPILTEKKTNEEIDFIIDVLDLPKESKILDLPCGHGRHSIILSEKGYKVTGIDIQEDFITLAKEQKSNVDFLVQDMRKIEYDSEFDAVINMFTSLGYFDEGENALVVKKMSKTLKSGGKLLIDTVNREWIMHHTGEIDQAWMLYPDDNLTFLANNSFDVFTGRMHSKQVIVENNERHIQEQDIRLYTFTELRLILEIHGLEVLNVWGSFKGEEYTVDSKNMIILAQKI